MKEFYEAYYELVDHSPVHHRFCERIFGKNLAQHGFADMEQLELLIQHAGLEPQTQALDLGCGNGMIAEYLSERTEACITGIDYIPAAIRAAQTRTAEKSDRLRFQVGDINRLELPPRFFDVIMLVDTIYFSDDYTRTIRELKAALRPNGRLAIFFSYGREPDIAPEDFPKDRLPPDKTPLAEALQKNAMSFDTWDLTKLDYRNSRQRKELLPQLKTQFERESAMFIYENQLGEANCICLSIEDGIHKRYLYIAADHNMTMEKS